MNTIKTNHMWACIDGQEIEGKDPLATGVVVLAEWNRATRSMRTPSGL